MMNDVVFFGASQVLFPDFTASNFVANIFFSQVNRARSGINWARSVHHIFGSRYRKQWIFFHSLL